MGQSDLQNLLDMGFEKERAELAVKSSGSIAQAIEWLEKNENKSLDEIKAALEAKAVDDDDEDEIKANIAALESGAEAKSLVCNECGKRFRNQDLAAYHATKSGHQDFSQSTEEIAPMTEEEKKAHLASLQDKLKEKRARQAEADKEDAKRNEKIRMKATKESQDLKEELQRKEQIKEAARKRQEKKEDDEAKRRIKAKIEADKEERRRKAEEAKAAREGRAVAAATSSAQAVAAVPSQPRQPATARTEARLRLQTGAGNLQKTLPVETTLFEVAQLVEAETGVTVASFTTTFPKKKYEGHLDFAKTLKEAGLVPSAVLIIN